MTRICPVKGCETKIRTDQNMCRTHWRRVPKALQADVWDAWHEYKSDTKAMRTPEVLTTIARLRNAQCAAVEAVEKKEQ